jgi:death-on-curing protein
LAGCYAFALATGHAFCDGNKRTSMVAILTFLMRNGAVLLANEQELLETWERLGARRMTEADISAWIRGRLTKLE